MTSIYADWIAGGMVKEYYDLNIAEQLSKYGVQKQ